MFKNLLKESFWNLFEGRETGLISPLIRYLQQQSGLGQTEGQSPELKLGFLTWLADP